MGCSHLKGAEKANDRYKPGGEVNEVGLKRHVGLSILGLIHVAVDFVVVPAS